jgi:hypothetical protein
MQPMTDQQPAVPAAPAGWYPEGVNGQRYWDGAAWTDHRAPAGPMVLPMKPRNSTATAAIVFMFITLATSLTIIGASIAWIPAIVGLACGIGGLRESRKVQGAGKARSVWAIVICGGGIAVGVLALIFRNINP